MANAGREDNSIIRMDKDHWINNHVALQDGARLQAGVASHMYAQWHTKKSIQYHIRKHWMVQWARVLANEPTSDPTRTGSEPFESTRGLNKYFIPNYGNNPTFDAFIPTSVLVLDYR